MEPPVKMYSLSTCAHCKAAKRLLEECNVKYDFADIDLLTGEERLTMIEEVKRINERCTFPTIVIGDQIIVGFQEDEIKKALALS